MNAKYITTNRVRVLYPAVTLLSVFVALTLFPPVLSKNEAEAVISPDLYGLSIASTGNVAVNLDPTVGRVFAISGDSVTVSTNSPSGYNLYISSNTSDNKMTLRGDELSDDAIVAASGTSGEPAALVTTDSFPGVWGYAVAGLGNFDAAYSVTNPSTSSKFAATPTKDSEALIHSHSGVATNDTTDVYYGFKVSRELTAGSYESTILYTTMADVSSSTTGEAIATGGSVVAGYTTAPTVTVNTSLSTSRTLGAITATIGGRTCTDLNITSTNPLNISCKAPTGLTAGMHDIMVNIPRLGKSYTITNGFEVIPKFTCTKRYRLQNADGTYPSSYTTDSTESIQQGLSCSYSKSVSYYQAKSTSAVMDGNKTLSLDLPRNTYTLTVNRDTSYVSAASGAGTYRWGQSVSISATVTTNGVFNGWTQTAGTASSFGNANTASTTFTMPKSNATIKANGKIKTFTCTKRYRLQNADGTYPSSYASAGTETINYGATCSYTQTYSGYQQQSTSKTNMTANATLSLDLPRNTYCITGLNNSTDWFRYTGDYGCDFRWGQTVTVSGVNLEMSEVFDSWGIRGTAPSGWNDTANPNTFTMPQGGVTFYVNYKCGLSANKEVFSSTEAGEHAFVVRGVCPGRYKILALGAPGGDIDSAHTGGNGGRSIGTKSFSTETVLYINVGGVGTSNGCINTNSVCFGGTNGGGAGHATASTRASSGGGASHVSTVSGGLNNANVRNGIIIVAGGGGGVVYNGSGANGGLGGGAQGGKGNYSGCDGGSQTAGGSSNCVVAGTAGFGGSQLANGTTAAGGGGGWFGGGAGETAGGGGSGYLGSGLTDATMENGIQDNWGRVTITYLGN
jgi:hypothetical protein